MMLQLDPPMPVEVVGGPALRGGPPQSGLAHLVIDYGPEHHLLWVVVLDGTRELWSVVNGDLRGQHNYSMGRP